MTQAYVDGNEGWGSTSPFTLTLPGDIAAGQVVYVYASVFSNNTEIGLTGMANPGSLVQMYFGYNGANDSFMVWAFLAGAGDAGAVLTYTEVGASTYIGSVIQAYSGANVPPANGGGANVGYAYANGGFVNTGTDNPTAPAISGGAPVAGCWAGYWISAGIGDGDGGATYSAGTLRQQSTASGVNGFDSNGSLGAAGSTVGGGTFTTTADGPVVMIVAAIPPASATVAGVTATITPAAPAGSVHAGATIAGAVGASVLAAPAGAVSAGATVSGPVATESLAAPAGAVRIAPQQGTVTISNVLAGSVTIVNTI